MNLVRIVFDDGAGRQGYSAVWVIFCAGANPPRSREDGDIAVVDMVVGTAHVVRIPPGKHDVKARLVNVAHHGRGISAALRVDIPLNFVRQREGKSLWVEVGGSI